MQRKREEEARWVKQWQDEGVVDRCELDEELRG